MTNVMAHSQFHVHEAEADRGARTISRPLAIVAPRHADGADWPWLSRIGPMRQHRFTPVYIENTLDRLPKATRLYVRWQYLRAMARIRSTDLAFMFSTDIAMGMTAWPSQVLPQPKRVYVGFTQDGEWPQAKINRMRRALNSFEAVTVFSADERRLYIQRYGLDSARVRLIPIHTDEIHGYRHYPDQPPIATPYALSLGSPNRRFAAVARACRQLKIPLVIITRPTHRNDSLNELAAAGATIITDADRMRSLTYLKHARLAVMAFQTPALPGAFTTIIHAMFLGTPCIVTSCLGMGDYVRDGETGLIVPHGDEEALRAAIDRLWNSPALIEQFTVHGLERAETAFSLEAAAGRFHELTQMLLAQSA